ncbi:MAG TPA: DUF418 domain-containing protein, partial [Acidimicrobiales bacterium]|nr:DUF418 domain-containing protein [Acidimicrobiales bacterium]
ADPVQRRQIARGQAVAGGNGAEGVAAAHGVLRRLAAAEDLAGAWVVRLPLRSTSTQWALLAGSVVVAATQPLLPAAQAAAHSNRTAWYVLATATAVAVLAACLLLGDRLRAVVPLGQMALTAYLAHLLLGEALVFGWLDAAQPALAIQMSVATAMFAGFAVAASAWLAVHRRGPVEAAVRTLAR